MRPICVQKREDVKREKISSSQISHLHVSSSVSCKHINLPLMFLAVDLAGNFVRLLPRAHKNTEFILPMLPVPNRKRPPAGHRHAHLADIFRYLISSHDYSGRKCITQSAERKCPPSFAFILHSAFCTLHSPRFIAAPPPPTRQPQLPPPSSSASRQSAFPAPYPS